MRSNVLKWLETLQLAGSPYGRYKMNSSTEATPFTSCFACFIRHLLDGLKDLEQPQRTEWLDYLLSFQDADTGLFIDTEIGKRGLTAYHDKTYVTWQLTSFCISAVDALGGKLKYSLRVLEKEDLLSRDGIYQWLDNLDWYRPWNAGNRAMFLGILLIQNHEMLNSEITRNSVEFFFDWHDAHQNPKTGFWGKGRVSEYCHGLFGGYHQYLLYFYWGRKLNYQDKIIDKTLRFQRADNLFAPELGGGGCEDLDAIDTLTNLYFGTNYRRNDIVKALMNAYPAIKALQKEDGGFMWGTRKYYTPLVGARIVLDFRKYSNFYEWYATNKAYWCQQLRVGQPRKSPGWYRNGIPTHESDLFSTWVRLLTISFIWSVSLGYSELETEWRYLNKPGLGWFDKSIILKLEQCNKMRVLWISGLTVDTVFQFTSANELARAFGKIGVIASTIVFYKKEKVCLDGFYSVEYLKCENILQKFLGMYMLQKKILLDASDVITIEYTEAYLIPILYLKKKLCRRKQKIIMDIRTVPVDLKPGLKSSRQVFKFYISLKIANLFCDGITVITKKMEEKIVNSVPRLRNRIGVWTSGVDFDHFNYQKSSDIRGKLGLAGDFVVMYHGILSPNRGLQNVIKALAIIQRDFPGFRFLTVGDGPAKADLLKIAHRLNVASMVMMVDKVPYGDMPQYIKACDMGILPFPDIEWWNVSSPLKLMEYLAMGKKVIVTEIPAHRNVIDNTGGGFFIKDNKPESIAAAFRKLGKDGVGFVDEIADVGTLKNIISWESQAKAAKLFIDRL